MSLESQLIENITDAILAAIKPHINNPHRLLCEEEAMAILNVDSPNTMRRYRQYGLPAYQPTGRQYYYFTDEIEAFVKRKGRVV